MKIAALLALVFAVTATAEAPRVSILRVTPRLSTHPTDVRVEVRVEHHPDNRQLAFAFACTSGFEQYSDTQLDGELASLVYVFTAQQVPSGKCAVQAALGAIEHGREQIYRTPEVSVEIYGPGYEPDHVGENR